MKKITAGTGRISQNSFERGVGLSRIPLQSGRIVQNFRN